MRGHHSTRWTLPILLERPYALIFTIKTGIVGERRGQEFWLYALYAHLAPGFVDLVTQAFDLVELADVHGDDEHVRIARDGSDLLAGFVQALDVHISNGDFQADPIIDIARERSARAGSGLVSSPSSPPDMARRK